MRNEGVDFAASISIHALREEGDDEGGVYTITLEAFLSTPSARRATVITRSSLFPAMNFYPRPPRGGRHVDGPVSVQLVEFLSTPSARRATVSNATDVTIQMPFLSTPSARRATR